MKSQRDWGNRLFTSREQTAGGPRLPEPPVAVVCILGNSAAVLAPISSKLNLGGAPTCQSHGEPPLLDQGMAMKREQGPAPTAWVQKQKSKTTVGHALLVLESEK